MMKTTLQIQNLKCGGCEATIYKHLSKLKGIDNISINVENSIVQFEYLSQQKLLDVKETLLRIGYPVQGEENSLITKTKSYVSCAIGRVNN